MKENSAKFRKCPFCGSDASHVTRFVPLTHYSGSAFYRTCDVFESEKEAVEAMNRIVEASGPDNAQASVLYVSGTKLRQLHLGAEREKRLINRYVVIPAYKVHYVGCSNFACFAGNGRSFSSEQKAMDAWNGTETENKKEEPCSI